MEVRLDKFLWSVRLFKTRALATDACRLAKVKMNDVALKPSKQVQLNETYTITIDQLHKVIRVKQLLNNRVGAKLVENYIDDLTPQEEYDRVLFNNKYAFEKRDRGVGRPTKKERRTIEDFKSES